MDIYRLNRIPSFWRRGWNHALNSKYNNHCICCGFIVIAIQLNLIKKHFFSFTTSDPLIAFIIWWHCDVPTYPEAHVTLRFRFVLFTSSPVRLNEKLDFVFHNFGRERGEQKKNFFAVVKPSATVLWIFIWKRWDNFEKENFCKKMERHKWGNKLRTELDQQFEWLAE